MGLTQGLLSALLADTAMAELPRTAFGVVNLVSGSALLGIGGARRQGLQGGAEAKTTGAKGDIA